MFKSHAIGIEITPTKVYVVSLCGNKVSTYCSVLSPDWFEREQPINHRAIANAIKSLPLKSKRIAASLPSNHVTVCDIVSDTLTVESLLKMSGHYFASPIEELDIDCLQVSQGQFALIGSERMLTDSYISVFKQAGLTLEAVESSFFSLLRAFEKIFYEYKGELVAIINVKESFTELIVAKGCVPIFVRSLPIGLAKGSIDALIEEICHCIKDKSIISIFLIGCGERSALLAPFGALQTPIINLDLFDKSVPASYEVAYGLALRKVKNP